MISHEAVVAVDLGKTQCRVLVVDGRARVQSDGVGAPGLAASGGVDAAFGAIVAAMPADVEPRLMGIGAAGALADAAAAGELSARLSAHFGCSVAVTSDVVTAHAGALGGAAGVLLIAGTGAVALGVTDDGVRMADGWGPELGDFGSGAWIGREGLRATLAAGDGRGDVTSLSGRVSEELPAGTSPIAWLSGVTDAARRCGTIAPLVLEEAAAGDRVAGEIVDRAVRELAHTAATVGGERVVLHGGLTSSDFFRIRLTAALADRGLRAEAPLGDALDGAALIATTPNLLHERAVYRVS